jgi:hypothetical protein
MTALARGCLRTRVWLVAAGAIGVAGHRKRVLFGVAARAAVPQRFRAVGQAPVATVTGAVPGILHHLL